MTAFNGIAEKFVVHEAMRAHLRNHYHFTQTNMPDDHIALSIDFSENYEHVQHHQLQQDYFNKIYSTLFIVVGQRRVEGNIQSETLVFMSGDRVHDAAFTHHCLDVAVRYFKVARLVHNI